MEREKFNYFHDILTARLNEALALPRKSLSEMMNTADYSGPMDELDLIANRSEQEHMFTMEHRSQKLVLEIRAALWRLKNGSFGKCEECGSELSFARLKAQPMALLCVDCRKDLEISNKRKVA